jgi:LysR family transcriptional regulator, regulator for metE and metH
MLERAHLAILFEINKRGSLTAAADQLCVTQSALSHSVKKLEQQLGTALWVKEGRRLRLTQAGQHLLNLAQRLLPQFEQAESRVRQIAAGQRGILRIGIECHPCYEWLMRVVTPYLRAWPDVDLDVKQQYQFGGIGALFQHEIDLLVTPDPLQKRALAFTPVFDYEQVLVVNAGHPLTQMDVIRPEDLANEILLTYPVETERLDIFNHFLTPAGIRPRQHKTLETTEILFQMVAAGRGVCAAPRWLVERYAATLPLVPVSLGKAGVQKQIFLGYRKEESQLDYLDAFIKEARTLPAVEPS